MTTRGTLRIYLGYAAGVGKTFAMLGEGMRRRERGTDVVVGFVETHGRPKTRERLGDLEVIPRRTIEYRGSRFEEMDVDAILAQSARDRADRRAGAHERPGLAQREAMAGRRGAARGRDRRHLHRERPAPGVVERRRRADHRREATRDDPGRGGASGGSGGAGRHDAVRAPSAHGPRQHLSGGEDRRRPGELLPRGKPGRAPRVRAAVDGRPRGRGGPGLHAGPRDRGSMGDARTDPGRRLRSRRGRSPDPPSRSHGHSPRRRAARRPRDPRGGPRRRPGAGRDAEARRDGRRGVQRGGRPQHAGGAARLRACGERHAGRAGRQQPATLPAVAAAIRDQPCDPGLRSDRRPRDLDVRDAAA